jgi:hypothetical protein
MHDPEAALRQWWALVRPGGYLVVVVPHEDLYEQGMWPSAFNSDHKGHVSARHSSLVVARILRSSAHYRELTLLRDSFRRDPRCRVQLFPATAKWAETPTNQRRGETGNVPERSSSIEPLCESGAAAAGF